MTTYEINQLIVCDNPDWGTWPITSNRDFTDVLAREKMEIYVAEDVTIKVRSKFLPAYKCFADAGYAPFAGPGAPAPRSSYPTIDNTKVPPAQVLDNLRADLEKYGEGCSVIYWDHAVNCWPQVAEAIPSLFNLAILPFADDCPGSSDVKTFPVAQYFDALFHQMRIWDFDTGATVEDKYREINPDMKFYWKAQNESGTLLRELDELYFDLQEKIRKTLENVYPPPVDLVFIGASWSWCGSKFWRGRFCEALNHADWSGLLTQFYGQDMRDGFLGGDHRNCYDIAQKYSQSLCGVNPQVSSIFNGRLIDLWATGVIQIIHDPHGELAGAGFEDGTHYVGFDGTTADLRAKVIELKADPPRCADIMANAYNAVVRHQNDRTTDSVYAQLYADFMPQILGGR
ncbi:MAG: glycosyltransferase family 1 protein [bacterium]|nr:glycosyltransferase family 1 protein [bacterium]